MSRESTVSAYNLLSPEVAFNPYPLLHKLRAEAPVYWSPQLNGWVLTKYDDIASALRSRFMSPVTMTEQLHILPQALRNAFRPLRDCIALWMGNRTHQDNSRMQLSFKRYFTAHTVNRLRVRAKEITEQLIDGVQDQGEMDVVRDLAFSLPAAMIAEMFGMPLNDSEMIERWSRDIQPIFDQLYDVDRLYQSQKSVLAMSEYVSEMIRERRHAPGEDIISVFAAAQAEGEIHNEDEILANCILLLFAGYETTANLINNGLLALFEHPNQMAKLKANPALLDSAVEEMLRYDGPTQLITRIPITQVQIGGQKIAAHQLIFMVLSAANRDPAKFAYPDRFNITRKKNRHIAFGFDSLYCLGASLARMEAEVCFSTLLHRLPNIRPNFDSPTWRSISPLKRTLVSLPVLF